MAFRARLSSLSGGSDDIRLRSSLCESHLPSATRMFDKILAAGALTATLSTRSDTVGVLLAKTCSSALPCVRWPERSRCHPMSFQDLKTVLHSPCFEFISH